MGWRRAVTGQGRGEGISVNSVWIVECVLVASRVPWFHSFGSLLSLYLSLSLSLSLSHSLSPPHPPPPHKAIAADMGHGSVAREDGRRRHCHGPSTSHSILWGWEGRVNARHISADSDILHVGYLRFPEIVSVPRRGGEEGREGREGRRAVPRTSPRVGPQGQDQTVVGSGSGSGGGGGMNPSSSSAYAPQYLIGPVEPPTFDTQRFTVSHPDAASTPPAASSASASAPSSASTSPPATVTASTARLTEATRVRLIRFRGYLDAQADNVDMAGVYYTYVNFDSPTLVELFKKYSEYVC